MTVVLRGLLRNGERDWRKLAQVCVQGMLLGTITKVASATVFRTTLQGAIVESVRGSRGGYAQWFKENPAFRIDRRVLQGIIHPLNLSKLGVKNRLSDSRR
jgi:hypothetical protein